MLDPDETPIGAGQGGEGPPWPLRTLPANRLRPDPAQPRRWFPTVEELADPSVLDYPPHRDRAWRLIALANSIRQQGVLVPVHASESADGTYQIIYGERRWRAATFVRPDFPIPVYVRDHPPVRLRQIQVTENIARDDLTLGETLLGIRASVDEAAAAGEPITSPGQLQPLIGDSQSNAYRWWGVLNGPADVYEAVANDEIANLSAAYRASQVEDPHERRQVLIGARKRGRRRGQGRVIRSDYTIGLQRLYPQQWKRLANRIDPTLDLDSVHWERQADAKQAIQAAVQRFLDASDGNDAPDADR